MERYNPRSTLHAMCFAAVIALDLIAPRPVTAQRSDGLPRLIGLVLPVDFSSEARMGAITPRRARTGFDGTFEWGVGSFGPSVRPLFGVDLFHADAPRDVGNIPDRASITSAGALAGIRVDANPDGAISPYAISGVTGNYVWATGSDKTYQHDLQGARFGFALGGGAAFWHGALPFALTGDVRHVFSHQNARTIYTVGLRVQPRFNVIRREIVGHAERARAVVEEILRLRRLSLPDVENVETTSVGFEIVLGDALFIAGTAELSNRAVNELASIADVLQLLPGNEISVRLRPRVARACADARLARQQALAVRQKLVEARGTDGHVSEGLGLQEDGSAPHGSDDVGAPCHAATVTILSVQLRATGGVP